MTIYTYVVVVCWAVFIIYWIALGLAAKRTVGVASRHMVLRIVTFLILLIILAMQFSSSMNLLNYRIASAEHPFLAAVGALLCAIGIVFAIRARSYLGRNWGMPQAIKESPELVTSGPYSYVRHPIYTGVILAMIGTGLVTSLVWLALVIFYSIYFIHSAYQEEKTMLKVFPETYPPYKARTKMLIPFIY